MGAVDARALRVARRANKRGTTSFFEPFAPRGWLPCFLFALPMHGRALICRLGRQRQKHLCERISRRCTPRRPSRSCPPRRSAAAAPSFLHPRRPHCLPRVRVRKHARCVGCSASLFDVPRLTARRVDLPYHPPFDFELPDYVQVGRTLLGLAHAPRYDEVPVSDFEVARLDSPTWDSMPLPEFGLSISYMPLRVRPKSDLTRMIESDDRFYLEQGIVRASPLESEAREPARESPARILNYARAARGGIALCSLNRPLGLGDVDAFQP